MKRFHKTLMKIGLGNLNEASRKALVELLPMTNEHDGEYGPEHKSWTYYEVGRFDGQDVFIASHNVGGPREPDLVWTGTRWICSEDELSQWEIDLMDAVAEKCPGGLGGWS